MLQLAKKNIRPILNPLQPNAQLMHTASAGAMNVLHEHMLMGSAVLTVQCLGLFLSVRT